MKNQFFKFSYLNSHISNLILGIILIFITACSLFKEKSFYRADSLLNTNLKREVKTNRTDHSKGIRIYVSSDSTDRNYFTEIFPKGSFNYSPEMGFSGEAERIVLKGRVKERIVVRDSAEFTKVSSLHSEKKEVKGVKMQILKREKLSKGNNNTLPILACCVMLILVLVFIFRKFFNMNFLKTVLT